MSDELSDKLCRLEEHQMFLERQVEQLSAEVLELSQLLRATQKELRKLQAEIASPQDKTEDDLDQQARP